VAEFRIEAKFDSTQLLLRMRNGRKRLAYAAVNAINKTAKLVQKTARERVEEEFTVRKPEFIRRQAAIIKPFASVKDARPFATISVGQKPRLLLSLFERGAERKPATPGARYVAEPVVGGPARPSFESTVPVELRMKRLRFERTKSGKARKSVAETGTYLIPGTGIFQRIAGGESRLVYFFTRGKKLQRRLRWEETAKRIGEKWLSVYFEQEVQKAVSREGRT